MRCLVVLLLSFSAHAVEVPRRSILGGGLSGFLRAVLPPAPRALPAPDVVEANQAATAATAQLDLFREAFARVRRLQLMAGGTNDWRVDWTDRYSFDAVAMWAKTHDLPPSLARDLGEVSVMLNEVHTSRNPERTNEVRRRCREFFAHLERDHSDILEAVRADATLKTIFTDEMVALERRVAMRFNIPHPLLSVTVPFVTEPTTIIRAAVGGTLRFDDQKNPYGDALRAEILDELHAFAPYYAMILGNFTEAYRLRPTLLGALKVIDKRATEQRIRHVDYVLKDGRVPSHILVQFSFRMTDPHTYDFDPRHFPAGTSFARRAETAAKGYVDRLAALERLKTELGVLDASQLKDLVLAEVEILQTELRNELRILPKLIVACRMGDRRDLPAATEPDLLAWAQRIGPLILLAGLSLDAIFPAPAELADSAGDGAACAAALTASETAPALPAPADATFDVNIGTVAVPEDAKISSF